MEFSQIFILKTLDLILDSLFTYFLYIYVVIDFLFLWEKLVEIHWVLRIPYCSKYIVLNKIIINNKTFQVEIYSKVIHKLRWLFEETVEFEDGL